jgi:hypothetical protein
MKYRVKDHDTGRGYVATNSMVEAESRFLASLGMTKPLLGLTNALAFRMTKVFV